MLFELRPTREPIGTRGHELGVGERELSDGARRARVKLVNVCERADLAATHRGVQPFGIFSEMFERRVIRKRTCWHSDLLARVSRAGGLWSATSGEEVACRNGFDVQGGLGPFRGLEAPLAPALRLDLSGGQGKGIEPRDQDAREGRRRTA